MEMRTLKFSNFCGMWAFGVGNTQLFHELVLILLELPDKNNIGKEGSSEHLAALNY
jgi:hypothetical protein